VPPSVETQHAVEYRVGVISIIEIDLLEWPDQLYAKEMCRAA
jgi:hypothetical protein